MALLSTPGSWLYVDPDDPRHRVVTPEDTRAIALNGDARMREQSTKIGVLESYVRTLSAEPGVGPGQVTDLAVAGLLADRTSSTAQGVDDRVDKAVARASNGVRPESFGEGAAALEAAIREAAARGGHVLLTAGKVYPLERTVSTAGTDVAIRCDGASPAVLSAERASGDVLRFSGDGSATVRSLVASQTVGHYDWKVGDTSGIEPGMIMAVKSSKSWYYDPRPEQTDGRKSELHLVHRVEDGVVWTVDPANDGYVLPGESVEVSFVRPIRVDLENFIIRNKKLPEGPSVVGAIGVRVEHSAHASIRRVWAEDCQQMGFFLRLSFRPVVEGGGAFGANGSSSGYGLQFSGCDHGVARGMLFWNCGRGADVSGAQIISRHTLIEDCTTAGGGKHSNGTWFGWGPSGEEAAMCTGFGTHGTADRTTYRGCTTMGVHRAYNLRGGNERIENATHIGGAADGASGVVTLLHGEHLSIDGFRVLDFGYSPYPDGGRDTTVSDKGANMGSRRASCFLYVTRWYKKTTAHVYITNVDAQVRDTFAKFDEYGLFTGAARVHMSNIRVRFLSALSADACAVFRSLAPTVAATGDKWTIGPIAYERDNVPSGAGPVTLTSGVNLAGAQIITYGTSGATS